MRLFSRTMIALCCISAAVPAYATSPEVEKFKTTWVSHALALQRDIDLNVPFNQATFISTHNSENSKSYQIPFLRYVDPNQLLSIYDQLEMGVRSIEYDVHWYRDKHLHPEILLSHALSNHIGCSMFDRPVQEGLEELRDWLRANPGEVVILYFDRGSALDGHEPRLAAYLEQYLGEFMYKPTVIRPAGMAAGTCLALPTNLTKADILKAGKQLLVVTKDCDGPNPNPRYQEQDQFPIFWNDNVFAGIGDVPHDSFNMLDSTIGKEFTPYPDCSRSTTFAIDPLHTTMWRIFEDRTKIDNVFHPGRTIEVPEMKTMVDCGINMQTLDMLDVNDPRLTAAVWSWAVNYPQAGQGSCAMYKAGEGIENISCEETLPAFACKNTETQEIKSVPMAGKWQDGESVCQSSLGSAWHFGAPVNGNQMYLLKQSVTSENVWLNYRMNHQGRWLVG